MAGQGGLATEVRTGLTVINGGKGRAEKPINKLDELYYRKPIRQHVREFAAVMSILMLIIAGLMLYRGKPIDIPLGLVSASLILLAFGYLAPKLLCPVWEAWMKFAHVLGFIMTGLILMVAWVVAMLPTAIALKIFRIKVMDMEFKKPVDSYWEDIEVKRHDFKLLERQF